MFLKKLESVGFKSFAERITVDFVPGVTAVVGPNGSGKSNITDAIRWVLGEQSAKSLRGTKMEDIIFQGSDSRKPLNFAEVTLVLDNEDNTLPIDYHEVSVTRRVYRSGESEFYLNQQSCRLKDIVDLFMDSGLGREAFSIISQGKVEEILSSKAEERRTIFEEAAGVLKYKNRKKKAESKLSETQDNLNRVEDIIYEIEGQLEPLKEQASLAKAFITHKETLTQTEISLLHAEIVELHRKWNDDLQKINQLKKDELSYATSIQSESATIEKEQLNIQKLDQTIEEMQQHLLALTEELEKLTGNKNVLEERTKNVTENKRKVAEDLESLKVDIANQASVCQKDEEQLADLQADRKETERELLDYQSQLSLRIEDIEEQIEKLKSEYIERLNEQAAHRNEQQTIENQLSQLDQRENQHQSKLNDQHKRRDDLLAQLDHLKVERDKLEKIVQKNDHEVKHKLGVLEEAESERQAMQNKLLKGYQVLEKLKSRKEMLEEMKEDFQGFFHGVKSVLMARDKGRINGIHGAVIELTQVPEPYVSALETALGGQAQHIVVDDDKAARQAIHWLKQTNNGRATFLPLKTMRSKKVTEALMARIKNHDGFVGIASSLVQTEQRFQVIIDHLLGNTIIAKTLKDANDIATLVERRFRVVTLDGDVVNPGGSMAGGARKKTNQSLFTRERDLQEATDKLNESNQRIKQFEQALAAKKNQISEYEATVTDLNNKIKLDQDKLNKIEAKLAESQVDLRHYDQHLRIYSQDKQQLDQDRKQLRGQQQEKVQALADIKVKITTLQEQIEHLTQKKTNNEKDKESLRVKYHELEVRLAQQTTQIENQTDKTAASRKRLDELMSKQTKLTEQMNDWLELERSQQNVSEINQEISEKQAEKQKTLDLIQSYRNQRLNLTTGLKDKEAHLKTIQNQRQALIEKIQNLEVKANRLDVELDTRLNHLESEYEMSFEKAKELYPKAENLEQTRQKVKLLKRTIADLGTVNLGAIDEYERIAERYQFLNDQQADLIEAKDTLFQIIYEMDEEMERRFEQTFSQIKKEFAYVFTELFGGGHAALTLTEPDNLLTTGVDIKAQPPGKKAQQLALLSGGERALTAIALLFAILRVRPVPFCVLDEVEAALDEANVNRFANYLKQYSRHTQFIVITHRKGTMEGADVLYGVTMQESGVSRFVSVKLEETKELLES